ncbi:MAG TPA: rhodanese-like domain-containing protein [Gaiellaceae bacterium]|nr:rhodanese-like domain-containing protein [Gaiellaceae bacterium]
MGLLSLFFGASVSVEEAADQFGRREAFALDVRERREWKAGRIVGSKHIPSGSLAVRTAELDANRRYIAVCRSGARSSRAASQLRKEGFDVVNLKGGMLAWRRAKLPLEPRGGRVI